MLKRLACVLLVVGCGGSASRSPPKDPTTGIAPAPRSACSVAADHAAQVVLTFKDAPKAPVAELAKIIASHCESDAWSADSIQCWKSIATETDAEKCSKVLTEDQHQKVFAEVIQKFYKDKDKDGDGAVPVEAPPPQAPDVGNAQPPTTPAPTNVKAPPAPPKAPARKPDKAPAKGDPCGGGE